jgi:kynurenine formamidase
MKISFFVSAFSLLLGAATLQAEEEPWIDLTHDLSAESVFWPTADPFKMTTDFEGMTERGYYYSAYSFTTAEHGGTHIDAPVHFAEGRNTVDEIPLEQLTGHAVVIDVSDAVSKNRDHLISIADIEGWEQTVLVSTGPMPVATWALSCVAPQGPPHCPFQVWTPGLQNGW